MNYTTQELTTSLQELTAQTAQHRSTHAKPLPAEVPSEKLAFSKEVQTFLETSQDYTAKTRTVNVGSY